MGKLFFFLIALATFCFSPISAAIAQPSKLWNGLTQIAPGTIVVYGKAAPAEEQKAAKDIAAALQASGGPENNLLDDEAAFADLNRTASSHLILVGTYTSNELLKQQWGHWAIDRKAFFAQTTAPDSKPQPPFYADGDGKDAGTPRTGFYVNSFGDFLKPATGYIESGRNDLSLLPSALAETPLTTPLKLCIKITGVGSAGVARAATIFLRSGMVNGVLPASDESITENGDAFVLSKSRYVQSLPPWMPREKLLGWILPDSADYAGLLQAGGQAATQIYRAKYLPDGDFKAFEETPHRRASDNEIFVAQMASPEAAVKAAEQMVANLSDAKVLYEYKLSFSQTTIGGKPAWKNDKEAFHIAVNGNYLLMETLSEPRGAQLLDQVIQAQK